jgi:hypothetical protein
MSGKVIDMSAGLAGLATKALEKRGLGNTALARLMRYSRDNIGDAESWTDEQWEEMQRLSTEVREELEEE